jgi:preprotein translocase subunit SecE
MGLGAVGTAVARYGAGEAVPGFLTGLIQSDGDVTAGIRMATQFALTGYLGDAAFGKVFSGLKKIRLRKTPSEREAAALADFVNQVRAETAKIVWPTREETVRTAIFVFIFMVILSLFFLGVDSAFGAIVRGAISLLQ